jgi:polysaccharide biosynthesis transport protein
METIQQQSFPITEARLVGPADAPLSKSYPKTWLILLLALVGGSVLSFGAAALRDILDRVFRSSEQVEEELQADCLAMLPLLKSAALSDVRDPGLAESMPAQSKRVQAQPMLDIVLEKPLSQFSEALRSVKVASDLSAILKTKKVTGLSPRCPVKASQPFRQTMRSLSLMLEPVRSSLTRIFAIPPFRSGSAVKERGLSTSWPGGKQLKRRCSLIREAG